MVAKKRTGLRAKAARLSNVEAERDEDARVVSELPPDPKAFLHQHRETKKEKLQAKSENFISRITEQNKNMSGISKSSLRRRKRKMRDELKPKMDDLLNSLQQEGVLDDEETTPGNKEEVVSVTKVTKSAAYGSVTANSTAVKGQLRKNEPNIKNQKGAKLLAKQESKRFNEVLANEAFQKSPFEALKEAIRMRQ
ncbi:Ribosome biogenesis protein SLX9 [Kluyveromyces marxianus]|uniref:Ribosome biogenesis protein SLX9 n=2 Tax=Kluyveromyces marxianus TaxID=4911 RepID=W0T880_KLUMD|nr:ribosome biogenesis protein SLX9 [Kluyveromyces marxianus DMKU3-1042]KAG0678337.1 ribosome biogenesis protein slx9 [Kluyveromyces marxianus]KAG0685780.1 ribosome biogenesis protein slx9 [Kluyveromyces marxianus]QGN15515.1 ribosome biogenesis protein SLX9 [Kluyveromyces marxianus]BAO39802.1 ribosome biogenesis protein SLX9 [Kluyveromyces marxianus DMKU3-1042]BAP71285.1 ribosome biogenesis protein SLX9 [Kluyveromyces marxianus]